MAGTAPLDSRYTCDEYLALVDAGVLRPDDRVELLDGVIVSMAPQNPPHASGTALVDDVLREALGKRAAIRVQLPLVLGRYSMPEPDVAVVPGKTTDYLTQHPTTALLVVETADSSLAQDRLTKARIYAAAGIPEYWLLNLRDGCVEVFRAPDPTARRYGTVTVAHPGDRIDLVALPGVTVAVQDLLPPQPGPPDA
jgi:Uma2 family endonuclease